MTFKSNAFNKKSDCVYNCESGESVRFRIGWRCGNRTICLSLWLSPECEWRVRCEISSHIYHDLSIRLISAISRLSLFARNVEISTQAVLWVLSVLRVFSQCYQLKNVYNVSLDVNGDRRMGAQRECNSRCNTSHSIDTAHTMAVHNSIAQP